MLKARETYEIITPEEIGLTRADEAGLVLGELPTDLLMHILCGLRGLEIMELQLQRM